MIPNLWSITGPASATLSALGVERATLRYASASIDTLDLEFADPNHAASAWSAGTAVVLLRDEETVFRGKVAHAPRSGSAAADSRSIHLEGPWADLDRLPFAQSWTHWNGTAVVTQADHPRVYVGAAGSDRYSDTALALAEVIAYAAAKGVSIAEGVLPAGKTVPRIEAHGRSCSDILRQILRWHPECAVWIDYGPSPPELHVVDGEDLDEIAIDGSGAPLGAITLVRRDDLVPTNVVLSYEAVAGDSTEGSDTPYRRRIYRDTAGGTSVGVGTILAVMPVTLPAPAMPSVTEQEMITRAIPAAGATDAAAERWWIAHSPLARWGIGTGDVALASTTAGDIYAHTIAALALPEVSDGDLGSGVELPEFWTDDIAKLGREIVVGQVQEWMQRSYGRVIARATIAIRKTAIEALGAAAKAEALRLCRPELRTVGGLDAYLLDLETTVAATNAVSKVYSLPSSGTSDGEVPDIADQIIPGLAAAYYASVSTARWEGSISLLEQDPGAVVYMGKAINVTHAPRSEWATMQAMVQSVSIDIAAGATQISVGAPEHLSLQDFAELQRIAREPQVRASGYMPSASFDRDSTAAPAWGSEGAVRIPGPAFGPQEVRTSTPPATNSGRTRWTMQPVSGSSPATWTFAVGKLFDGLTEISITGTGSAVTPTNGQAYWLEVTGVPTTTSWTAALTLGTLPTAEYTVSTGVMSTYKKVLATFHSSDPGAGGIRLAESLWVRPRVPDSDLAAISTVVEDSGDAVLAIAIVPW